MAISKSVFQNHCLAKQCPFSKIAAYFLYNEISGNTFVSLIAQLVYALRLGLDNEASVDRNRTRQVSQVFFRILHGLIPVSGYPTLLVP